LGIGDWAQSPIPNPQSPIPNPQFFELNDILYLLNIKSTIDINIKIYNKINYIFIIL
jgi:hypothetical protein